MENNSNEELALGLAQNYLRGNINFEQFIEEYPENTNDKDVDLLFDLIEHEPKIDGLLGVGRIDFEQYRQKIKKVIIRLEERIINKKRTTTTYKNNA